MEKLAVFLWEQKDHTIQNNPVAGSPCTPCRRFTSYASSTKIFLAFMRLQGWGWKM